MSSPLTVLILSANPKGTSRLRLDEELREIKEGLTIRSKLRDNFQLVAEHAVRPRDVHRALLNYRPFILHFSGHGTGAKGLLLEDDSAGSKEVSGEAIAPLLGLFKDSLQCVVLNACYSERQAQAIREHIPFVVGMSEAIGDKAAIEFSVAFYDAIGAGRNIPFAFELATRAIKMAGIDQAHIPVLLTNQPDEPPPATPATIAFSTYNPQTFTGRETETQVICEQLQKNCRIVAIVGMTGVGKTTLAERAIDHLAQEEDSLPYVRFSLDDRSIGIDFPSGGAALLRELGDELTLEDQQDPTNLVNHIISRLQSHPCRLQIDSLERLLKGNEQEGWSEFSDPLWLSLLQRALSANQMESQLILTTQDIPGDLESVGDRFNQFWFCQTLQGLSQQEQVDLFQKLGLVDDQNRLKRIGQFYDGHPLVLQVIADEIKQRPFNGSVDAYWNRYGEEFEAATPQGKVDRSRTFRTRVRQRVEQTIESLPDSAKQLLCTCSVFRRPVPETFWIEMSEGDDPYAAFDSLQGRKLLEYVDLPGQPSLLRQHNLIRSVSYGLLKEDSEQWEQAERKAANLWLTAYVPPHDAPNLETIRGYLEAFDHFCEIQDWDKVKEVAGTRLNTPTQDVLGWQLFTWGYFQEEILFYKKYLKLAQLKGDRQGEGAAMGKLGLAYDRLGQFPQAIYFHQQHRTITRKIADRLGEGVALGNLGMAYDSLGQLPQAILFYKQSLTIARAIGNRQGESITLGNLGNAYHNLGQFPQAINSYQQSLTIARAIGDQQAEANALGNLGNAYYRLNHYQQAIDFSQQSLTIARAIGDRYGEGVTLVNLGETQRKLQQYSESLANNQAALQILQDIGDRRNEAEALLNLAKLHHDLNDTLTALPLCQQALVIASELGVPLKAECEEWLDKLTNEDNE